MGGMPGPAEKIGQGPGDRPDVLSAFLESQQEDRTIAVDRGVGDEEVRIAMLIVGKRDSARRNGLAIGMESFVVEGKEQIQPYPASSARLVEIEMTPEERFRCPVELPQNAGHRPPQGVLDGGPLWVKEAVAEGRSRRRGWLVEPTHDRPPGSRA